MMSNIMRKISWKSKETNEELNNENIQLKGGSSTEKKPKMKRCNCLNNIKNYLISSIQAEISYMKFGIMFMSGLAVIGISMIYLPIILIKPKKFAQLFALGTFVSISSFIYYYGTFKFFELLFKRDRICFTLLYIIGFLGTFIFPIFLGNNYFIILACSSLEVFSTLVFILTFLPGGYSSIQMIINFMLLPIKRLFNRV